MRSKRSRKRMKNTEIKPPKTPELEKEAACREEASTIGQFLEWLMGEWLSEEADRQGIEPCEVSIFDIRIQNVLHEYFEIDPKKTERERRELLLYQRLLNEESEQRKVLIITGDQDG